MVIVGKELTVTVAEAVPVHPFTSVPNTLYVLDALTVIAAAVELTGLHEYVVAPLAVSVTEPPWQKVVGPPGVMVGVGAESTVTFTGADVAVQLLASVIVTE